MALTKHKLGEFTELYNERCGNPNLTVYDISGVNADKEFFEPSKQAGADTSNYKNVPPDYFACNLMHVGRDKVLPIALNHSGKTKVVSPAYTIFRLKEGTPLLREYFFMMLKSEERDRYFWFHTDSSVRDGMSWDDFCDLEIDIPPISIQKKYVDVYNAMLANQQSYERGLEDLNIACMGYIERLRRSSETFPIGDFIEPYIEKNVDGAITLEQGINIDKQFITPQRSNSNLTGRRIVRHGMFAYCTQLNNENVAIAYRTGEDCVVSSVYDIFRITRKDRLLPEYLMLWLIRSEFGRYVYWASEGSAYEFLNYDNLANYKIPVPDLTIQHAVGDIYLSYVDRKQINDHLKERIKSMCPILIKGSLEEAGA
jgi:type I restriction enzyme S subunit